MKNYSFEVSTRENLSTLLAYFYPDVSFVYFRNYRRYSRLLKFTIFHPDWPNNSKELSNSATNIFKKW